MVTVLIGAACFYLHINISLSDECIDAKIKGKVFFALFVVISVKIVHVLNSSAKVEIWCLKG